MTTFHKRLLFVLLAVGAGAFLFVQSLNVIVSGQRDSVHRELQKLFGSRAGFATLEVKLWGGPGFSARDFRIADNPRFAATPLLHATELRLGVSVWQLLLGNVVIDSLALENPEFQIITDEQGALNLAALGIDRSDLNEIPKARDKRHTAVDFEIRRMRLRDGRVDFFDRSLKEPAELQINNINLELSGLHPDGKTALRLQAALTEGLRRDVTVEGELGPIRHERAWSQQPMNLDLRFDSLYLPMLARALPFLRNKIPRELEVTGPMSLYAKVQGNFDRPQITDVILKVPCFGSSDYNAVLTGNIKLPQSRSWDKARLEGKLTMDPINLANLRNLSVLKELLPNELATEGSVSIYSRFEGSWERLRAGVSIKADKGELRYRDWLQKPAGHAARLVAQLTRDKQGMTLHASELRLGKVAMRLSGVLESAPQARLQLRLQTDPGKLAAWQPLLSALPFHAAGGNVNWDLVVEKNLALADESWSVRGKLTLADAEIRHQASGKTMDQISANVSFFGQEARTEAATFRLGSSRFALTADVRQFAAPSGTYRLSSADVTLSDLPLFSAAGPARVKKVTADGTLSTQDGVPFIRAVVTSAEGSWRQTAYRDLRGEFAGSPADLRFSNVTLHALNGNVRADGAWSTRADGAKVLDLVADVDGIDAQQLTSEAAPDISRRLRGAVSLRGRFNAVSRGGTFSLAEVSGSGEAGIYQGTLKDFNLFSQFFSRGGEPAPASRVASLLPASLNTMLDRSDTPFDALKTNFVIASRQLRAENLSLSTPDYTITAAGSIGFDGQTRWSGSLALAPWVTQELQREYRMIRYLLDRRGRLAISFRVDGILPSVKVRPENRALAQALRFRTAPRSGEPAAGAEKDPGKERTSWLRQSVESWLHRN